MKDEIVHVIVEENCETTVLWLVSFGIFSVGIKGDTILPVIANFQPLTYNIL